GVSAGTTSAAGASIALNTITDAARATVTGATVISNNGKIALLVDSHADIVGIALGVSVATGTANYAGAGSVAANVIVNTLPSYLAGGSTVTASGEASARVVDHSRIIAVTAGVGLNLESRGSIGAAISYNRISNGLAAYIGGSTVTSNTGSVVVSA